MDGHTHTGTLPPNEQTLVDEIEALVAEGGGCNTPPSYGNLYVHQMGIDDVTLTYDLFGSPAVARIQDIDQQETRYGNRLIQRESFGKIENYLGRHYALWNKDTGRLTVQAKLAPEGALVAPSTVREALDKFDTRLGLLGLLPPMSPCVRRLDVAVDVRCHPGTGRALLDGLGAARLKNGMRTMRYGDDPPTVYFKSRVRDTVKARTYCRNSRMRNGEPMYGLMRMEAQERFDYGQVGTEMIEQPAFLKAIWDGRFGAGRLAGRVERIDREVQTMTIAEKVAAGEIGYAVGERLGMFLDLERLGLARSYYPTRIYAERRREAQRLGLAPSPADVHALDLELDELLMPARDAWPTDE